MEQKVLEMKINDGLTTVNFSDANNPNRVQYIVIHYTANNGDTAENNIRYFKSAYRGASAHYFVDEKEIWRSVADEDIAWHCGAKKYRHALCRNSNSIGIEMCSRRDSKGKYYIKPETVENTIELTKKLMKQYGVPADRVLRHHDVTGKICPEPFVRDVKQWNGFKSALTKPVDKKEEEVIVKKYNTVAEMPEWAKPTIERLIAEGALSGTGKGLDLTLDMIRTLVIMEGKRYDTIEEIPGWAQPTIKKLIENKVLQGADSGLDLTKDMIRTLMMTERMIEQERG